VLSTVHDASVETPVDAATVHSTAPDASRMRPDAGRRVRPDARVAEVRPDAEPLVVAPPDARPAPPPDAEAAPAKASFSLEVDAWCDLSVDGAALGRLDAETIYEVEPGRRAITCTQGKGMASWTQTVTLRAGQHRKLTGSLLADIAVTVAVRGGDQVRIGGTLYKNGAKLKRRPGRVKIDVLKGEEVVDGRWVTLPAVASCTLKDDPDLDCYP
jgi:hypothetical protein